MIFPFFKAGSIGIGSTELYSSMTKDVVTDTASFNDEENVNTVSLIYDSLHLNDYGLTEEVLEFAFTGYQNLLEQGMITRPGILTICDFSQSSSKKRLYIIDMNNYKLLMNTYVAHGKNTGDEYARNFSNKPESLQSSLGFYITHNTYFGEHGLSLKVEGLEKGFNDKAMERAIVIHGSDYADERSIERKGFLGRSWGCPAIPEKYKTKIINEIKNGTCLFIYHPTQKYLKGSTLING